MGRHSVSSLAPVAPGWIQSFLEPMLPLAMRRTQSSQTFRTDPDPSTSDPGAQVHYPGGFEPLRSDCRALVSLTSCPIIRNPFVSPLLAPSDLLRGLPPVHIVVGAGPPSTPVERPQENVTVLFLPRRPRLWTPCWTTL